MNTTCGRYANAIAAEPGATPKVKAFAMVIGEVCEEWANTDDFVQSAVITLKWHQVFPPNRPSGGGSLTCGAGTHQEDGP